MRLRSRVLVSQFSYTDKQGNKQYWQKNDTPIGSHHAQVRILEQIGDDVTGSVIGSVIMSACHPVFTKWIKDNIKPVRGVYKINAKCFHCFSF